LVRGLTLGSESQTFSLGRNWAEDSDKKRYYVDGVGREGMENPNSEGVAVGTQNVDSDISLG